MADIDLSRLSCFLAVPFSPAFRPVRRAIVEGVQTAGLVPLNPEETSAAGFGLREREIVLDLVSRADFVIADLSSGSKNIIFEAGLAHGLGKNLLVLQKRGQSEPLTADLQELPLLRYTDDPEGLSSLAERVGNTLEALKRVPRGLRLGPGRQPSIGFLIDWNRLEPTEIENLSLELLVQMGFQAVDWSKETRDFDLVAELPKKDPDGAEYRELWLVSFGRHIPPEALVEMLHFKPERLLRSFRELGRSNSPFRRDGGLPTTLLFILPQDDVSGLGFEEYSRHLGSRGFDERFPLSLRVRVWGRAQLTQLVHQFPQIGYKYFSDEERSRSRYRKTPDELYQETVELSERQAKLIAELQEEKDKRVRAERDAIWKDISFAAAHKMGNPIFAIETFLDPLSLRISTGRNEEAKQVITSIRSSVEKAKNIVDQFKSLTRAQQIAATSIPLKPILEDACKTATIQNVTCTVECDDAVQVQGDPERLAECFDELVANSLHWLDKEDPTIRIRAIPAVNVPLPSELGSKAPYVQIQFEDNGSGVALENKRRIFDAFFTTQDHGTGLGLALVRRIIEGHGGTIFEQGVHGKGADFEIYLPEGSSAEVQVAEPTLKRPRRKKD